MRSTSPKLGVSGCSRCDRPSSQSVETPQAVAMAASVSARGSRGAYSLSNWARVERSIPVARAKPDCVRLRAAISTARRSRNSRAASRRSGTVETMADVFANSAVAAQVRHLAHSETAGAVVQNGPMQNDFPTRRAPRAVEWPTVVLAAAIYGFWALLTWFHGSLPWWCLLVGGGWVTAWHNSFQHEVIHGHPTRWPAVNRALGRLPLSLWLPFDRYRALHLAHHRDHFLTDPLEDPETQYFTAPGWLRLGPMGRAVSRVCARLAGRLVIGPVWAIGRFLWRDARRAWADQPGVRAAWGAHLPGLAAVLAWLIVVCRFDLFGYVALFVLPGMSLLLLRSLAEHRAAEAQDHRTAVVEAAPVLGLLFLFNNLHVAHHERPALAWYRLPAFYRRERARLLRKNGGLIYAGYADVARRFLLTPHDRAVHPFRLGVEPAAVAAAAIPVGTAAIAVGTAAA